MALCLAVIQLFGPTTETVLRSIGRSGVWAKSLSAMPKPATTAVSARFLDRYHMIKLKDNGESKTNCPDALLVDWTKFQHLRAAAAHTSAPQHQLGFGPIFEYCPLVKAFDDVKDVVWAVWILFSGAVGKAGDSSFRGRDGPLVAFEGCPDVN